MWSRRYLTRIDFRVVTVVLALMLVSLLVLSTAQNGVDAVYEDTFFTPLVKQQLRAFALGWGIFLFLVGFDYNKLREWAWVLYVLAVMALVGLFFAGSIAGVHRWYRIPGLGMGFQPSEFAKLTTVITLSWFLERRAPLADRLSTAFFSGIIVLIPFFLILKQPDLGSAIVLFPITVVMFYFGDINRWVLRLMNVVGGCLLGLVLLIFIGVVSHEEARPIATRFLKGYQYERLKPDHHQKAAMTAIALGGVGGTGWRKSEYASGGWLPMPHTDSVFPTFGEEHGFVGLVCLMALFYALLYFSFQVTAVAKDHFGRLLAAGVAVYLAMHIVVNTGMMSGLLPITGVPLVLVTYGGSSVLATMAALGILQSIYSRRFMF